MVSSKKKILKNQVAVVTGASLGVGRAVALRLASLGADVAFNYQFSQQQAELFEAELKAEGVKTKASRVDIKDYEQVKKWIEDVKEKFGRLDILVNNAGIIREKALMAMTPDDWREVMETNLSGVFNASRACVEMFMKNNGGSIVNISAVNGVTGLPRQINDSASKGGISAMTKALALEVANFQIRVNAVVPGFIDAEILSGLSDEQKLKIAQTIPLGRLGSLDDVANCVEFLLSEEARYITGQVLFVDGGLVMR